MPILGVIPARYASTRFPGKPLADIHGQSMIRRVYTQACQARLLDEVVVATDDARIYAHVEAFGGQVEMTADTHRSGTERCAEIVLRRTGYDHYVNIQGDEPYIDPAQLDQLCTLLRAGAPIATLASPLHDPAQLLNPGVIKVVLDHSDHALYFSRAAIPYCRDQADIHAWPDHAPYYRHIGIYGFAREVLLRIPDLTPSPLEVAESLEQLRWLAHGLRIRVGHSTHAAFSVDTPEDLARLLRETQP
ncbi:MAG: 3-deoxy-manno-octulosonate cytidylyltransferase [Bacteroidia bacterium]